MDKWPPKRARPARRGPRVSRPPAGRGAAPHGRTTAGSRVVHCYILVNIGDDGRMLTSMIIT